MKNSFWISLLVFILYMCSCKTQKSARLINEVSKENVQTELFRFEALTDTSNVLRIEIDKTKLKITEIITTTKYDKDTGAITEETKTERTIAQDSDKVVAEEEQKRIEASRQDSLNHIRETTKKVESETKEESIGSQESFGKWLGIGIACVIGFLTVYLVKKLRIN